MSTHRLSAWIAQQQVGTLSYHDDTGRFSFEYESDWAASADAFPIAPALPFHRPTGQTDELHSVSVRRFFENLLPEGKAMEDAAAAHAVSKANLFGLLRWLGQESTGALSLLPEGKTPAEVADTQREVTYAELSERIHDRANRPFNIWDGRVRMSIAGYQDKLAVYVDEAQQLYLVEGRLASTHILKPEPLNPKLTNLVANEHFCLKLAERLGLQVAAVDILRVPEPVLIVERFDRRKQNHHVERLHAIDTCQVLNLSVSHKYERNFGNGRDVAEIRDGLSLEKLFAVAPTTQAEAATRMELIRWSLLQYLIGNSDAHGKNLSFLVEPGGLRLAPAYDLVAVCIYPDIDHELAMAIGDEFDIAKIRAFDWADFAQRCGVERRLLVREMNRIIKAVRTQLPSLLAWPGYRDNERALLDRIASFALQQAEQLANHARLIADVQLD
ncbi:MAG: HipA domain-containing protein [Pseudomonadota bacterium]|nr:HipA domain-containing protein [Pseudomonadota bacterium]